VFAGRLIWWPQGIIHHRRVAILSSRIPARHDLQQWWFDLLRTAVFRVRVDEECAVAVTGTAAHKAVTRAAEIFGVPVLSITVDDRTVTEEELLQWLICCVDESSQEESDDHAGARRAFLSPQLESVAANCEVEQSPQPPLRDRFAMAAGERCYVLACRLGGHVDQCLRTGLLAESASVALVFVSDGPGTTEDCLNDLTECGAIPWLVDGIAVQNTSPRNPKLTVAVSAETATDGPLRHPQDWLCHWTRPCGGPWPEQPATEYMDELLLGCETADRSALATLLRIVSSRVVLASVIRHQQRAVSFTEVPLNTFRERRIYRRHRRRYDFEPWGIAIRRDVLVQRCVQPVQYGTPMSQPTDAEATSVWFQPATDQSGQIDWREEREWRLVNDLELHGVSTSAICLFVDTSSEAEIVRAMCDWPVVVVPVGSVSGLSSC